MEDQILIPDAKHLCAPCAGVFFCLRVFLSAGLIKSHRCGILKQILRKGGGGNVHRAKQAAGAGKTGQDRYPAGGTLLWSPGGAGHGHLDTAGKMRGAHSGSRHAPGRLAGSRCGQPAGSRDPAGRGCDEASGGLPAGSDAGSYSGPRRGCTDPPGRGGGYCRLRGVGRAGFRPGGAGGGCRRSRAAAVGRAGGKVPHGPLLAGLRRLAHHGAAESSGSAGHRPAGGHLCAEHQPDDPPQERDGHSGPQ